MSSCTKRSNLSQNNFGYLNHYQDTNQMNRKLKYTTFQVQKNDRKNSLHLLYFFNTNEFNFCLSTVVTLNSAHYVRFLICFLIYEECQQHIAGAQLDSLVSVDYSGAPRAKKIWLTMHPRNFGINKIVLTSVRPPYHVNGSEMSHLLAGSPKSYTICV